MKKALGIQWSANRQNPVLTGMWPGKESEAGGADLGPISSSTKPRRRVPRVTFQGTFMFMLRSKDTLEQFRAQAAEEKKPHTLQLLSNHLWLFICIMYTPSFTKIQLEKIKYLVLSRKALHPELTNDTCF